MHSLPTTKTPPTQPSTSDVAEHSLANITLLTQHARLCPFTQRIRRPGNNENKAQKGVSPACLPFNTSRYQKADRGLLCTRRRGDAGKLLKTQRKLVYSPVTSEKRLQIRKFVFRMNKRSALVASPHPTTS